MGLTSIKQLVSKARKHIQNNDIAGAIKCYKKIAGLNNNDASTWSALGSLHGRLGQYPEAAACFRKASRLLPDDANAHLNLAKCLHSLNDLEQARNAYDNSLRLNPNHAETLFNIGTLLSQQKDFKAATHYFQRLIKLSPDYAPGYYSLGSAQIASGLLEDAVANLREATRIQPDLAEAHNSLGITLHKLHHYADAEASYRRSIDLNQNDVIAQYNLGTLFYDTARFSDAKHNFRHALKLKSDYKEAYVALGLTHHACAEFQAAIDCYETALTMDPRYSDALINLGQTRQVQGNFDLALAAYQEATRIDPQLIEGITGEASIMEHNGDFESALALIQPLIGNMPCNANLAVTYGILAHRTNNQRHAITFLEHTAANSQLSTIPRAKIHFCLGNLYQDINDYDNAFHYFYHANNALNYHFDRTAHVKMIDVLIDVFNQDAMKRLPRSNNISEQPVFIVAMPRSGTSLVEQILASHPEVYGAGELPYIGQIRNKLCRQIDGDMDYPACLTKTDTASLDKLANLYMGHQSTGGSGHLRFTDKMPQNFLDLALINLMLPNARVIHVIRDPMDTCLSIYTQHFAASHSYSSNLEALGFYYRQYERLMRHWRSVLSIPILDIHYADIVTRPEDSIRELLAFCGLEWNDACLNFHHSKRLVTTPSYNQVRQPIYTSGLERWKKYKHHLAPLRHALDE